MRYIAGATTKGDGARPTEFLILTELCPGMFVGIVVLVDPLGGDLSKVYAKRGGRALSNFQVRSLHMQTCTDGCTDTHRRMSRSTE